MRGRVIASVLAGWSLCIPAAAQDDEGDFTFRRVAVPDPESRTPRITVQIDPEEQRRMLERNRSTGADRAAGETTEEEDAGDGEVFAGTGVADWFWSRISPALSAANPGRLEVAVMHLDNAPAGSRAMGPRLQDVQRIARDYGPDILRATAGTRVSPALVLSVIAVESAGREDARSSAGAVGLMQLMPATADRFGVEDRKIARDNIRGGVAFLDFLMAEFRGDPLLVLAAYNAGENAVRSQGGVPSYAETREYVPKVLAAWRIARNLCMTPPDFASDGCVFAVPRG